MTKLNRHPSAIPTREVEAVAGELYTHSNPVLWYEALDAARRIINVLDKVRKEGE